MHNIMAHMPPVVDDADADPRGCLLEVNVVPCLHTAKKENFSLTRTRKFLSLLNKLTEWVRKKILIGPSVKTPKQNMSKAKFTSTTSP